jgi:hypothetical protein
MAIKVFKDKAQFLKEFGNTVAPELCPDLMGVKKLLPQVSVPDSHLRLKPGFLHIRMGDKWLPLTHIQFMHRAVRKGAVFPRGSLFFGPGPVDSPVAYQNVNIHEIEVKGYVPMQLQLDAIEVIQQALDGGWSDEETEEYALIVQDMCMKMQASLTRATFGLEPNVAATHVELELQICGDDKVTTEKVR